MGRLADAALYPFRSLPPVVGLAAMSFLTSLGLLWLFKATSDQARLAATKRQVRACLFELRLFRDEPRIMARVVWETLRHNVVYLRLSVVPMLWAAIPLALIGAQLQAYYGYDGVRPGQSVLVKVKLKHASTQPPVLDSPQGLRVDSPRVWIPSLGEATWRVVAEEYGEYDLSVTVKGGQVTKRVLVSDRPGRRSPVRLERAWLNQVLYPAEPPLPDDVQIESITVTYPGRWISVLGWRAHWLVIFSGCVILFALALKKRVNVVL